MREAWTEKLRRKLEGHRKTPPAGLWDDISKEMGLTYEPVSKPIVIKRWYWTAAAILVLVGFIIFHEMKERQPVHTELSSLEPVSPQVRGTDTPGYEAPTTAYVPTLTQATTLHHIAQREEKESVRQEEDPKAEGLATQEEKTVPQASLSENEDTLLQELKPRQELDTQGLCEELAIEQISTISTQKLTLGINASGGLLAAQNFYHTGQSFVVPDDEGDGRYLYEGHDLSGYVSEHDLPIRFGLSLNYQLSPRLTLLSGISYTFLHSEFKMPLNEDAALDQKLHYFGIPLGLCCQLWSNRHFQIYVSGCAMLEKCLNDKPWQWSIDVAAGAEYMFTPRWGVYIEPSFGYYFNDGCPIEHYYKAHPWTPALELGLRLHLMSH